MGVTNEQEIVKNFWKNENEWEPIQQFNRERCKLYSAVKRLENVEVYWNNPGNQDPIAAETLEDGCEKETSRLIKGLCEGNFSTCSPIFPKCRQNQAAGIYFQKKQLTLS
jgi:hypothetical protein